VSLREQFIEDVGGHAAAIREILSGLDEDEACMTLAKVYAEHLHVSDSMTQREKVASVAALIDVVLSALIGRLVEQERGTSTPDIVACMVLGAAASLSLFAREVAQNTSHNKERTRVAILATLINALSTAIAVDNFDETVETEKVN